MSTEEKSDIPEKHVVLEAHASSEGDSEANVPYLEGGHTLRRTMKNRHIAMIRCAAPSPPSGACVPD